MMASTCCMAAPSQRCIRAKVVAGNHMRHAALFARCNRLQICAGLRSDSGSEDMQPATNPAARVIGIARSFTWGGLTETQIAYLGANSLEQAKLRAVDTEFKLRGRFFCAVAVIIALAQLLLLASRLPTVQMFCPEAVMKVLVGSLQSFVTVAYAGLGKTFYDLINASALRCFEVERAIERKQLQLQ